MDVNNRTLIIKTLEILAFASAPIIGSDQPPLISQLAKNLSLREINTLPWEDKVSIMHESNPLDVFAQTAFKKIYNITLKKLYDQSLYTKQETVLDILNHALKNNTFHKLHDPKSFIDYLPKKQRCEFATRVLNQYSNNGTFHLLHDDHFFQLTQHLNQSSLLSCLRKGLNGCLLNGTIHKVSQLFDCINFAYSGSRTLMHTFYKKVLDQCSAQNKLYMLEDLDSLLHLREIHYALPFEFLQIINNYHTMFLIKDEVDHIPFFEFEEKYRKHLHMWYIQMNIKRPIGSLPADLLLIPELLAPLSPKDIIRIITFLLETELSITIEDWKPLYEAYFQEEHNEQFYKKLFIQCKITLSPESLSVDFFTPELLESFDPQDISDIISSLCGDTDSIITMKQWKPLCEAYVINSILPKELTFEQFTDLFDPFYQGKQTCISETPAKIQELYQSYTFDQETQVFIDHTV